MTNTTILKEGEFITLSNNSNEEIIFHFEDIAKLALTIHKNKNFFKLHHRISSYFSNDINGSGEQLLYIQRMDPETASPLDKKSWGLHMAVPSRNPLIEVIFYYSFSKNSKSLYENNLIVDRGKDYMPSVSKGNHWFQPSRVRIGFDWNNGELMRWIHDFDRIKKISDNISDLIEGNFRIFLKCKNTNGIFIKCDNSVILNKNDIIQYQSYSNSIENIKKG